jgi:hypothetical protein
LKRLEEMFGTLDKLTEPQWKDACVYIYLDKTYQPVSLNVRQYAIEDPKLQRMRIQPTLGERGVFCPRPYPGEAWPDMPPLYLSRLSK